MKKQAYKISKYDWLVTLKKGDEIKHVIFKTASEAKAFMKQAKGTRQLFKLSYEFRDVMG